MAIWLVIHLFLPNSTRVTIILTLLSSVVAVVEISETAIAYALVMDLAALQLPLIVIYDAALFICCFWGQLACREGARYELSIYTISGALMAAASTFIGFRLSEADSVRMRGAVYLMKRAVMFGFLASTVSLHTIVGVDSEQP